MTIRCSFCGEEYDESLSGCPICETILGPEMAADAAHSQAQLRPEVERPTLEEQEGTANPEAAAAQPSATARREHPTDLPPVEEEEETGPSQPLMLRRNMPKKTVVSSRGGAPTQLAPPEDLPQKPETPKTKLAARGGTPTQLAPHGGAPTQLAPAEELPDKPAAPKTKLAARGGAPTQLAPAEELPDKPAAPKTKLAARGGAPTQLAPPEDLSTLAEELEPPREEVASVEDDMMIVEEAEAVEEAKPVEEMEEDNLLAPPLRSKPDKEELAASRVPAPRQSKKSLVFASLGGLVLGGALCYGGLWAAGLLRQPSTHRSGQQGIGAIPPGPDAQVSEAQVESLVNQGKFSEAVNEIQKLPPEQQNTPSMVVARIMAGFKDHLGKELRQHGKLTPDKETQGFLKELKGVASPEALLQRVAIHEELGQWVRVRELAEEGAKQYPKHTEFQEHLARAKDLAGK